MAGNAENVELGACTVAFGGNDLGYTSGGVNVTYSTESKEKTVDQEDVPIGEVIIKQAFEVKVPLAEKDLQRFSEFLPGAEYIVDSVDPTKTKLVLSGSAGTDLQKMAKKLIIAPVDGDANDMITIHHAIPVPNLEFSFEKDNVRVYTVTFKALKGVNGFVTWGDSSATAA